MFCPLSNSGYNLIAIITVLKGRIFKSPWGLCLPDVDQFCYDENGARTNSDSLSFLSLSLCLSPRDTLFYEGRKFPPDAKTLILDFPAIRTVWNKFPFIINCPLSLLCLNPLLTNILTYLPKTCVWVCNIPTLACHWLSSFQSFSKFITLSHRSSWVDQPLFQKAPGGFPKD